MNSASPTAAAMTRTSAISLLQRVSAGRPIQVRPRIGHDGSFVPDPRPDSVRGHAAGTAAALRTRASEQRGQTAAEYLGILLFVALAIGALIALNIDDQIAKAAKEMVTSISKGDKTD